MAPAGRQDDPVEEPHFVLEEVREVVELLREPAGGPGAGEAGREVAAVLVVVLDPDGQRVPFEEVEGAEQLHLAAVRVDLGSTVGEVEVEGNPGVVQRERILEAELIPESADPPVHFEPLDRFLVPLQAQRGGLALLP